MSGSYGIDGSYDLSLLVVRWGGPKAVDPVFAGDGGWGATGSSASDTYIRTLFEKVVW